MYTHEEIAAAKAHVLEMQQRAKAITVAAEAAVEPLKALFKGFNVRELDEALEKASRMLKDDMRI